MNCLIKVLSSEDQLSIKEQSESYIHAEATVPLFGFIDDVEFLLPSGTTEIHYRSASRLGTWDFWVNKLRMKKIKKKLKDEGLEVI